MHTSGRLQAVLLKFCLGLDMWYTKQSSRDVIQYVCILKMQYGGTKSTRVANRHLCELSVYLFIPFYQNETQNPFNYTFNYTLFADGIVLPPMGKSVSKFQTQPSQCTLSRKYACCLSARAMLCQRPQ